MQRERSPSPRSSKAALDERVREHASTIRSLVEQSVAGIYIIDLDGTIVYTNTRLAELCGYSNEEMAGHDFLEFVVEAELEARRTAFARLSRGEIPNLHTIGNFKGKNGETLELLTESSIASYEGRQAIIGVAAEVSGRTSAEHALKRANRALQTLGAANSALVRAQSEPELLQEICDVALATGAYSTAWIGIAEHDTEKTVRKVARAGSADTLDELVIHWDDSEYGAGPTGAAIRTAAPVIVRNLGTDLRVRAWEEHHRKLGHRAIIAVPLIDATGAFGSMTLASRDEDAFAEDEVTLLIQLASDISYGIVALRNRTSLHDAEQRSRDHATRLEALWKIINNHRLSDDELWQAMLTEAAQAIRPGEPFLGVLGRIHNETFVVEAVAETPAYAATLRGSGDLAVGNIIPLAGTAIEQILADGNATRSWDDLQAAFATQRIRAFGWQAGAFTAFNSGPSTYVLFFVSMARTEPWGAQDHAYIEVLASFFAHQAQERWQFDRIRYQQSHDVLTGLLNRSQFRSQARIAAAAGGTYAIISLDLSGFAEVNETYGNMIGDALLVEVAAGLAERAAEDEIVGRLGSDVFAIYVPAPRSAEFIRERALHFGQRFRQPFSTGDREGKEFVALTASYGIAIAPQHGATVDVLISHAGVAVSAAKARGRGTILFYEPGMEGDATRSVAFHNELGHALTADQFELYFQPHYNLLTGKTTGCEALIRWNHPERGLVAPGHFIPFAERSGLIAEIDAWVMRRALVVARDFGSRWPGFRLYFNLSGRQAGDPKLVEAFNDAAREGLILSNVGIEITESDAMRDFEATRSVCRDLRALGVRVALDDFGTGYSSLSSLKHLPIDVVKIDRSFVTGILVDRHDEAIIETIVQMTRLIGSEVLAEGVERAEELEWLRDHACQYVQGYYVSHPLPLDAFIAWMTART